MLRSSLDNGKEAHLAISDNFKHQEDVKLYIQLPDYGDFRGYDLGRGDTLNQVGRKIYGNSHKSSWQTLKHRLFSAITPSKLFRDAKAIAENDKKKGDFSQERMFTRVAKIPITNTFRGLVEMDFADCGDLSTFLHIRDIFHDFRRLRFFFKTKRKKAEPRKW